MGKLMEDDRRNKGRFTVMGLTKGQIISIGIATLAVLSGLFTQYQVWGSALNQIETNAKADIKTNARLDKSESRMEEMNKEQKKLINDVKSALVKRMDRQEKVARERYTETNKDIKKILRELK